MIGSQSVSKVEEAIAEMLEQFSENEWMLKEHWPLNEPHVRLMMADVMTRFKPEPTTRVFDVGCFNGYISVLFQNLGYQVTGADFEVPQESAEFLHRRGIGFVSANFNELEPFAAVEPASFDIIVIAQVIEHILNHPLGLIRSLATLMKPGGIMILTTPNPATVMSSMRSLAGKSLLWGTQDFIDEAKIKNGQIISKADIHYREYTSNEIQHMLTTAGLNIETSRFLGLGVSRSQNALKRLIKNNVVAKNLMKFRPFASNHYFVARKPSA